MIRRHLPKLGLALVALALVPASAGAMPGVHYDPDWRDLPAWTATIAPYGGVKAVPRTVCPFGISDLAAYTRDGRRRDRYVTGARNRYLVNGYYRGLRVYIFCG